MKDAEPCGGWPSVIGSADLVRGALRLSAPRVRDGVLYWLEGRPSEGGRQLLMGAPLRPDGGVGEPREVTPAASNVRSRVHEYGGGESLVFRDRVFFVDDAEGRLCAARLGPEGAREVRPLSPPGSRFADPVCSPDGRWLVVVEERPRPEEEPEGRLVAFALEPDGHPAPRPVEPRVVAAGHDFYASPVFSPDGTRLAWLAWDHPNMPWNGTVLEALEWGAEGIRGEPRSLAGGTRESLFQPRFSPSGALYVVTDRSGWWNLARVTQSGLQPVHALEAELGRPQWVFGQSTWDFVSETEVVASATRDGLDALLHVDLETGRTWERSTPLCSIAGVDVNEGWLACIAGSPTLGAGVFLGRVDSGPLDCVRPGSTLELDPDGLSRPRSREFVLPDGRSSYAFLYEPCSTTHRPRPDEKPPLLVKSHGGPTAAASAALDPRIQFWTSRGFAVVDVNYAGSTGFGRAYRDGLEREWGVLDVEDCVAVAQRLAEEGLVDGQRLAISGGSAGGFTTLCALTFHDVFAAGASHYGIGDLEALARDTHKFESRYTDWLVGEWPRERERYRARSPIHHVERLACPVIFFQGLEDRVVPPSQAEAMVSVLERRGLPHAYVPFEGEQHGFRRAENIRTALDGELHFYSRLFGFDAPRPAAVHVVTGGAD